MNRKGFTLVELLVVVIIVAILAVIALPQYFRTLEKSRTTEVLSIMGSLASAFERARLLSPASQYPANIGDLDTTFNNADGTEVTNGLEITTRNFDITVDAAAGEIAAVRNNAAGYTIIKNIRTGLITCIDGQTACATLGLSNP